MRFMKRIMNRKKLPYDSSTENLSDYARIMRKGSEGISNHIVPKSRDKAKARFAALKEGENFHNLDNGLKDNYAVPERTQNSIYLRLDSNRPSGTVIKRSKVDVDSSNYRSCNKC